MPIFLRDLLKKVPNDTEELVDRARKRVGAALRDGIRQETGLLLKRRSQESRRLRPVEENVSVPVGLQPGMPESLRRVEFEENLQIVTILCRYKAALQQSANTFAPLKRLFDELLSMEKGAILLSNRQSHLYPIKELIEQLLAILDKADPLRRILDVNEDVLGVYRYRFPQKDSLFPSDPMSGEIILYWAVIGFVAGLLGVSIEDLTVVVLAHEIAHAYTHLGADIDGERWDSDSFFRSEHGLKEGLAQYYTQRLCRKLQNQFPNGHAAYVELLKHQPKAYRMHEPWIKEHTPEEIRLAMLETRRNGIGRVDDFNNSLRKAASSLRHLKGK